MEFVDNFQEALALVGFKAYVDAKDVSEGEMAWSSLSLAIRIALVCVLMLSKTFAESKAIQGLFGGVERHGGFREGPPSLFT